jgi:cytochrome b561
MLFVATAVTGWVTMCLLAINVTLPYLLRYLRSTVQPVLKSLRLHYWLGFLIPGIAFVHAWFPMSTGRIDGLNQQGLWIATFALFAMVLQACLGLALSLSKSENPRLIRTIHFTTMSVIVVLVITHIMLNRA